MTLRTDVPAFSFAKAWQAVSIAAGAEAGIPGMNQTVHIEVFDRGLRLISCDGYMLAHVFVPFDTFDPGEPGLDEVPVETVLVSDRDGRGRGLMKYIEKQVRAWRKREEDFEIEGELRLSIVRMESEQATLDGLEGRALRLEWPDRESVQCSLVEDVEFVKWRSLITDEIEPLNTPVLFNPQFLRDIGKIGSHYPGHSVRLEMNGPEGAARFTIGDCQGLLMPVRDTAAASTDEDYDEAALELAPHAQDEVEEERDQPYFSYSNEPQATNV